MMDPHAVAIVTGAAPASAARSRCGWRGWPCAWCATISTPTRAEAVGRGDRGRRRPGLSPSRGDVADEAAVAALVRHAGRVRRHARCWSTTPAMSHQARVRRSDARRTSTACSPCMCAAPSCASAPCCRAMLARGRRRDRQHRLAARADRRRRAGALQRRQGGHHRPDQVAGARGERAAACGSTRSRRGRSTRRWC